jgi:hypothetical protein
MLVLAYQWLLGQFYQFGQRITIFFQSKPNHERLHHNLEILLEQFWMLNIPKLQPLKRKLEPVYQKSFLDEELGFACEGSVSYRNGINFIGIYHRFYLFIAMVVFICGA